jgi:hypothetical protein
MIEINWNCMKLIFNSEKKSKKKVYSVLKVCCDWINSIVNSFCTFFTTSTQNLSLFFFFFSIVYIYISRFCTILLLLCKAKVCSLSLIFLFPNILDKIIFKFCIVLHNSFVSPNKSGDTINILSRSNCAINVNKHELFGLFVIFVVPVSEIVSIGWLVNGVKI